MNCFGAAWNHIWLAIQMNDWKTFKFSDFVEINAGIRLQNDREYSFVESSLVEETIKNNLESIGFQEIPAMNEEQQALVALLKEAIGRVYEEERFLLTCSEGNRTGMEQAFAFRTGIYLSGLLQGTDYKQLDLDSEYNKNNGVVKSSVRFPRGVRPDLIIHKRDSNEENMLVAEFKGYWNNNIACDLRKLEDLTNPDDNYNYLIGVFVRIGEKSPNFRYFNGGREIVE